MSSNNTMSSLQVSERILSKKIFAILRGVGADHAVEVTRALISGGVELLEVTYDQASPQGIEDTLECIRRINKEMGNDICLGAGTVLSVEQVQLAKEAGAQFIVSPNFSQEVIGETKKLDMVSLPGALTPTEIEGAYAAGADMVKLFPGGCFGPEYIKAIRGPLKEAPLIVVGGVTLENVCQFLEAGAVGVGLGSNLVDSREAAAGNYSAIESKARAFVEKIKLYIK